MKTNNDFLFKKVLPVFGGALLGYAYYYFIGCYSGICPVTSNPYILTFCGAMIALIFVLPTKKKKEQLEENK